MRAKDWVLRDGIAALLALLLTYFILEPAPTTLSYGSLLGWSGMIGVVAILAQGFRKMEKQSRSSDSGTKLLAMTLYSIVGAGFTPRYP